METLCMSTEDEILAVLMLPLALAACPETGPAVACTDEINALEGSPELCAWEGLSSALKLLCLLMCS